MDGVQTLGHIGEQGFSYCYTCHRVHPYDGYGPSNCISIGRHSKTPGWDALKDAKKHMRKGSAELDGSYR